MKAKTIVVAVLIPLLGQADSYDFWFHRFGRIGIVTDLGKEKVFIEEGNKQGEEVTYSADLKSVGKNKYKTVGGTVFELIMLAKPIINDGNRRINSGDYKLVISGSGAEYEKFKIRPAFGGVGKTEFYGEERNE